VKDHDDEPGDHQHDEFKRKDVIENLDLRQDESGPLVGELVEESIAALEAALGARSRIGKSQRLHGAGLNRNGSVLSSGLERSPSQRADLGG